jgi:hypothetical protein
MPTMSDSIRGLKSIEIPDLSRVDDKRTKRYDPSKNHYKPENLNTLMKKIHDTPRHMVDYKNSLEQTMFKKKLGLEKINDFQMKLHRANVNIRNNTLPKLHGKSLSPSKTSQGEMMMHLDKVNTIEQEDIHSSTNKDLLTPQGNKKNLGFRSINRTHLSSKF